jgi:gliding motility-associated-like protein
LATYVLNVTVNDGIVPAFNIDTLICPGEVAPVLPTTSLNNIGGTWFPSVVSNTASATYMFTPASGECAVAVILNVVIGSPSYSIDTRTVCASDTPFQWNGIPNAGTGTVYTTANALGCDSIVTLQLTILPPPLIANYDTSACGSLWYNGILYNEGMTVIDTVLNNLGCDSFIRIVHITIYPNTPTVRIIDTVGCDKVLFEGDTYFNDVTLVDTFQNSLGCDSLIRKVNVIVDHFELDLDVIPEDPYKGEMITLEASANSDQFSVASWSPSEWFPDQEKFTYQLLAEEDGRIVISGINEHGCIDTAFVTYTVKPLDYGIFLPNAFSPNGDGVNDHFGPEFYMERAYVIKSFRIFNRWGQIVYSASGKANATWNGNQSNGQPSDLGTYSYFIDVEFIDKKVLPLKGDIILVR